MPEISPNVHPLVIHFPIAFLTTAVLLDLVALFGRRWTGVRVAAVLGFTLGAAGALAAFLTGRMAADSVMLPTAAATTLTDHEDWALRTLLFFGAFAAVRLVVLRFDLRGRAWAGRRTHAALFATGAAGLVLLVRTGLLGGSLVYEHGVGVRQIAPVTETPAERTGDSLRVLPDGSWTWVAGPGAEAVLRDDFRFLEGSSADVHVAVDADSAITLETPRGGPVLLVAEAGSLQSLSAEADVDLEQFAGTVRLVHHVQDAETYDFLEVGGGQLRLGRLENGRLHLFDEKPIAARGWMTFRTISDGTHFRGYAGDRLLTHGHGAEPPPGRTGLYLHGTGRVRLRLLRVQTLR